MYIYIYILHKVYPAPIPHLIDQHKKDVVKLWLVQEPIDELVPDTLEALPEPPEKKHRQHLETLNLIFGNITDFGHRVQGPSWTTASKPPRSHLHQGRERMDCYWDSEGSSHHLRGQPLPQSGKDSSISSERRPPSSFAHLPGPSSLEGTGKMNLKPWLQRSYRANSRHRSQPPLPTSLLSLRSRF